MDKIEGVVAHYIGMWEWIRDNLRKLKKEGCGIIGAKAKYLDMYGNPYHWGACLLCWAYAGCEECPLDVCHSVGSSYDMIADYLLGFGNIRLKTARESCDTIIKAHEDLKKNPTDLLRKII